MSAELASAIYRGTVRHRRFSPKKHYFSYDVFMLYIDTSELEHIFTLSPFWSNTKWVPARFKRSDFHMGKSYLNENSNNENNNNENSRIENNLPTIDQAVRDTVEREIGYRPTGPVRMLVNFRYWGYSINPLSTYYCFDAAGEKVVAILAEVHNTPWNERHAYVLANHDFGKKQVCNFQKEFHVSPFNALDMRYQWQSTAPAKTLGIHLENWCDDNKVMDATVALTRQPLNTKNMHAILIRFPWMTVKVVMAIYWQALALWLKGVPLFNHPKKI
jgi:uncharacterized protein